MKAITSFLFSNAACTVLLIVLSFTTISGCDFAEAHRRQRHLQQNNSNNNDDDDNAWGVGNFTSDGETENETQLPIGVSVTGFNTNQTTSAPEIDIPSDSLQTSNTGNVTFDTTNWTRAELYMIANQARGVVYFDFEENNNNTQVLVVSHLEVAVPDVDNNENATIELDWYAAVSLEEDHVAQRTLLAPGGRFQQKELLGNTTHSFVVLENLTNVGAILLCQRLPMNDDENDNANNNTTAKTSTKVLASALIQKLVPGPAADLLAPSPTHFENCLSLSKTARLRWTILKESNEIDIGLEYTTPDETNTYMAWGPASPGVQDRLMGGSDVIVAGFRELLLGEEEEKEDSTADAEAFAEDYYIGGYEVCSRLDELEQQETRANNDNNNTDDDNIRRYDGVCRDSIWASLSEDDEEETTTDVDNHDVELRYSQVLEGVAMVRVRRPLAAMTPIYDHDITPGTKQHFVWARGPLDPSQGIAEVQFHGYQYGQLKDIDVGEATWECPPLEGVLLDDFDDEEELDPSSDVFAQKFQQSVVLQGDVVEVFWTLMPETSQIHIGARANVGGSKWMSIAVGSSMTDAWAWVATLDGEEPQLLAYRMSGLDASTVKLVSDVEEKNAMITENPSVNAMNGRLQFETIAQWPLPGMDPGSSVAPFIYAVGPSWTGPDSETPKREDEHSIRSRAPTVVDFVTGGAKLGAAPKNSMLLAHGALMWLAWMVLAPMTGIASRYMRDDPCVPEGWPIWIQLHKYGASCVLVLTVVALILAIVAVSDASLPHIVSAHSKIGIALIAVVVVQNGWGTYRPPAGDTGIHRRSWEKGHRVLALAMLGMSIAAVLTGAISIEDYDLQSRYGVALTIVWLASVVLLMVFYEIRRAKIKAAAVEEETGEKDSEKGPSPDNVESRKPSTSPWISNYISVYFVPLAVAAALLVALAAVTFSGSSGLEGEMTQPAASASSSSPIATESPTISPVDAPLDVDAEGVTSFTPPEVNEFETPEDCMAIPLEHVGDGWCDDHTPFNTAACGWDGGDCCDTSAALYNCKDPDSPNFGKASPKGWNPAPIPRNPRYSVSREETLESWVTTYNNYYEFGLSKNIWEEAQRHADFLAPEKWYVDISGLVENPMTLDVPALINEMHLEERMYRHRCVEAWSITSPWIGFPLAKLLDFVKPTEEAAIVQFVSWKNFSISGTQQSTNYPWPYTEALTMTEARNELTMLTVGNFQKPLTPQQGAPIRLTVPWKYGFKSIKSIEKITFLPDTPDNRQTFWGVANPSEYSFWANINPEVPHRRWSQATERHFVTGFPGTRLDTTRMNGYAELVDYMYEDIEDRDIYF